MAYCVIGDIQDEMGQTFTTTSRPTTANVEEAIDGVSGEIDGVLKSRGYSVPVTSTSSLALLKRYTKFGASAQAWHMGYVGDEPSRVTYWREAYDNFIARLRRGEQELPDETASGGAPMGFSVAPLRVDGYSSGVNGDYA